MNRTEDGAGQSCISSSPSHAEANIEAVRQLCLDYKAGRRPAAETISLILMRLDDSEPEQDEDTLKSGKMNDFRLYRIERKGSGWKSNFTVLGQRYTRYIADSAHGSASEARGVAKAISDEHAELHQELLALRRRFMARRSSRSGIPGVARYEAHAKRGACWVAYWDDPLLGRRQNKRFAVSRYGEDEAYERALEARWQGTKRERARFEEILRLLGAEALLTTLSDADEGKESPSTESPPPRRRPGSSSAGSG